MSEPGGNTHSPQQSDALLWLAGAIIVGLGVTWLLLSQPWAGGSEPDPAPPRSAAGTATLDPVTPASPLADGSAAPGGQAPAGQDLGVEAPGGQAPRANLDETSLEHNPLRMAELAYEAGMLVEPEEYSAWALYKRALEQDPGSEAARRGIEKIADELLKRAGVAVEQGRFDDALAAIARVRSAIPAHPGANDLAFRIESLRPAPVPEPEIAEARAEPVAPPPAPAEPAPAREPEPARRTEPPVDPVLAPYERFNEALADNRLLTPTGSSARHFLDSMVALDADHRLTLEALTRFSDELLARANDAIIELDSAAAETWLDEAERLNVNTGLVADARERLRRRLIDAETARRVPVSALVIEHYVPPVFPGRALERSFEGWVDLEFTVGRDGATRDVVVTDASHTGYFRREAVDAVEKWRFQPRVYLGEVIEQRTYTRIRFTLNE